MKRIVPILMAAMVLGLCTLCLAAETPFPPVPAVGAPADAGFWAAFMKPAALRPGQTWDYAMECSMIRLSSGTGEQSLNTLTAKIGDDGKMVFQKGANDMASTSKMLLYLESLNIELLLEVAAQRAPASLSEYRFSGVENIQVKAGTYQTAKITKPDASGKTLDEWYAPGIGLVKRMTIESKQGVTYRVTCELARYVP